MINIETLTKECTNKNKKIIFTIGVILENYGKIYTSKKCHEKDKNNIHKNLLDLNKYSKEEIYNDTSDDMNDAKLIYFNSDDIWKR